MLTAARYLAKNTPQACRERFAVLMRRAERSEIDPGVLLQAEAAFRLTEDDDGINGFNAILQSAGYQMRGARYVRCR